MNRFLALALAAVVAATSLATTVEARGRGYQWHNHGGHHGYNRGWHNGRHAGWYGHGYRHGYWYGHGHGHGHWYGGYWGPGWGYWGGPAIVIGGPGYYNGYYGGDCYIKRVRHHDRYGHLYIRRVRVCY